MTDKRNRKRIIRERVKERHTSHWDLDMLSREELEALLCTPTRDDNCPTEREPDGQDKEPGAD